MTRQTTRKFARDVAAPTSYHKAGRSHVEVGFVKLGEQEPHFHVLGGTEGKLRNNRWERDLGRFALCADHDDVRKNWPEYAGLVRWHLCAIRSGPMHYEANALFWAEVACGLRGGGQGGPDPVEAFKRTVVWGALDTDVAGATPWDLGPTGEFAPQVRAWLCTRLPKLMEAFRADVEKHFPGMFAAAEAL